MALTRPKIWDIDTNIEYFVDPITVLHQGATSANVDVGFLFNRANGLVSNVALYWNESTSAFVTAFTSNTGITNSNILPTTYANITTGHHLPGENVTYNLGSPTQRWNTLYISGNTIDMAGHTISTSTGQITFSTPQGGLIAGIFSTLAANANTPSTSISTGTMVITGGAGISGNLYVGGNLDVVGTTIFRNTEVVTNTEYASTINATNVYATTIGNIGANVIGTGTYLTSLTATNVLGTVATANISYYDNISATTTNATYYPAIFSQASGNVVNNTSTGLTFNPSTSTLNTGTVLATTINASTIGNTGAVYTGSTLSLSSWANIAGPLVVTNNTAVQAIQVAGTSTKGGAGYHDFLLITNQGGGTNPNKTFRLNSTGGLEIINSAYSNNIFTLTDAGVLTVPQISASGSTGTSGQVLSSTGSGLQWVASGGFSGGAVPNQTTFASNIVAASGTASTNSTTGAVVVLGGVGVSGNVWAGQVYATNNGNGTNFAVGDDTWIGDINIANTMGIKGQQDATQGYIVFGNSNNTNYIGRSGTNPITVTGSFNVTNDLTVSGNINASYLNTVSASQLSVTAPLVYLTGNTYPYNYDIGEYSHFIGGPANVYAHTGVVRSYSNGYWGFFSNVKSEPAGSVNWTDTGLIWDKIKSGDHIIANTTAASSTTTGALQVAGGAGVAGAVYAGSVYDNSNRVLTSLSSSGAGNLTVSVSAPAGTTVALPATGPGAATVGSSTAIPVITTDAYGRINYTTTAAVVAPAGTLTGTTLASGVTASSLTSVGTITSGTWSGLFGAVSGANLTSLTAGNLTGTIPSAVLGASTVYVGTTAIALNRASASQSLTGISIDGSAATVTGAAQTAITSVGTLAGLQVNTTSIAPSSISGAALGTITDATTGWSAPGIGFGSGTGGHGGIVYGGGQFYFGSENGVASGTMGTRMTLTNAGVLTVYNNILPTANLTCNLGSATLWFNTFYGVSTQAKYADLAENYQADAEYSPGTVLVFGGEKEVTTTNQDHNTAVAGIVSTNPAHLMNGQLTGDNVVAVGLTGRLPCRVQGPVTKGDVLVTSTTPGVAQRIDNSKFLPGCIIGKALESINTNNIQTIEVVVGRF